MLQLNPSIPVVMPKGDGEAVVLIDYGKEAHLIWVVIQSDTGEIWAWENPQVRGQKNITLGRVSISEIK